MSRKQRIYDALTIQLKPDSLLVEDESHRHSVPTGAETHFKVTAVSTTFEHQSLVSRHRLMNTILASEFTTGLHALSLHLYTPSEWLNKSTNVPASPLCQKKSQKD